MVSILDDTGLVTIEANDAKDKLEVANQITPNGDGRNDVLTIKGLTGLGSS